jgi:multidrug efflux pump subunit AcrA (membrane-fusion protein)
MNRNRALILVLGLGIVAAACNSPEATAQATPVEATPPPVDVPVVTASVGSIEASLEISGTLAPRSRVPVKPRLPGTLERVLVDIGDAVTAGQTVATMDRREIDAQVDAAIAAVSVAKASLENAEAALANAVLEYDRAQVLFDKGALPRQRLDSAQTARRAGARSSATPPSPHRSPASSSNATTIPAPSPVTSRWSSSPISGR